MVLFLLLLAIFLSAIYLPQQAVELNLVPRYRSARGFVGFDLLILHSLFHLRDDFPVSVIVPQMSVIDEKILVVVEKVFLDGP